MTSHSENRDESDLSRFLTDLHQSVGAWPPPPGRPASSHLCISYSLWRSALRRTQHEFVLNHLLCWVSSIWDVECILSQIINFLAYCPCCSSSNLFYCNYRDSCDNSQTESQQSKFRELFSFLLKIRSEY